MPPAGVGTPLAPAWELEWRAIRVISSKLGIPYKQLGPDSRILEEVASDSLDLIELVVGLEEEFRVSLPDEWWNQVFSRPRPVTLRELALALAERIGSAPPPSRSAPMPLPAVAPERSPFLQMDGRASRSEWLDGPLYRYLGTNREGRPEYCRLTDGMRCIALSDARVIVGDGASLERAEISPFLIDAEPVANCAFSRFLNSVGSVPASILREWCGTAEDDHRGEHFGLKRGWWRWGPRGNTAKQPMILVSWYGAAAYSLWAHRLDWRYYRENGSVPAELPSFRVDAPPPSFAGVCLPSELEWEYAARGPEPRRYPWGEADPTPELIRVAQHQARHRYTAESLPAADVCERLGMSPFGVHHMAGNVWQWCRDWYRRGQTSPREGEPTGIRSERGGSWVGPARLAECSYRRGRPPQARGRCLGFRGVGLSGMRLTANEAGSPNTDDEHGPSRSY
jgi:acyl carrier protein